MVEEGKRTLGISFASSNREIKTGRGGIKEEGEDGGGNGVVSRRLKTMTDGVFSGGAFDRLLGLRPAGLGPCGKGRVERRKEKEGEEKEQGRLGLNWGCGPQVLKEFFFLKLLAKLIPPLK